MVPASPPLEPPEPVYYYPSVDARQGTPSAEDLEETNGIPTYESMFPNGPPRARYGFPDPARHVRNLNMVSEQLDYCFSPVNLATDTELRKHMDSQGFILPSAIADHDRIKVLTDDNELIRFLCLRSPSIDCRLGSDGIMRVRKSEGWEQWVLDVAERYPSAQNEGVEEFYSPSNPPQLPQLRPHFRFRNGRERVRHRSSYRHPPVNPSVYATDGRSGSEVNTDDYADDDAEFHVNLAQNRSGFTNELDGLCNDYEERIQTLTNAIELLRNASEALGSVHEQLRNDHEQLRSDHEELRKDYEEKCDDVETHHRLWEATEDQLEAEKGKVCVLEKQLQELQDAKSSPQLQREDLVHLRVDLEQWLAAHLRYSSADAAVCNERTEGEDDETQILIQNVHLLLDSEKLLREQRDDLEQQRAASSSQTQRLAATNHDLQTSNTDLQSRLTAATNAHDEARAHIAGLQNWLVWCRTEDTNMRMRARLLKEDLQQSKVSHQTLTRESDVMKGERDQWKGLTEEQYERAQGLEEALKRAQELGQAEKQVGEGIEQVAEGPEVDLERLGEMAEEVEERGQSPRTGSEEDDSEEARACSCKDGESPPPEWYEA